MTTQCEKTDESGPSTITFEQALAQLEAVVRCLEDGHIGLDESLARDEEGVRLLKVCRESLQVAEQKIMLLTGVDAAGNPVVEPFAEPVTSLEKKKELRTRRRSRQANVPAPDESCDVAENGDGVSEADRQKGLF